MVVASEAAGAVGEPLGPTPSPSLKEGRGQLLAPQLLNSLNLYNDILHRAYLGAEAAGDAVGGGAEGLVGDEVLAEEPAEDIGLEPGETAAVDVHDDGTALYLLGYLLDTGTELGELALTLLWLVDIEAREADVAVGHGDGVARVEVQARLLEGLADGTVGDADIVAAGDGEEGVGPTPSPSLKEGRRNVIRPRLLRKLSIHPLYLRGGAFFSRLLTLAS